MKFTAFDCCISVDRRPHTPEYRLSFYTPKSGHSLEKGSHGVWKMDRNGQKGTKIDRMSYVDFNQRKQPCSGDSEWKKNRRIKDFTSKLHLSPLFIESIFFAEFKNSL